jgi:hypothetical protein
MLADFQNLTYLYLFSGEEDPPPICNAQAQASNSLKRLSHEISI